MTHDDVRARLSSLIDGALGAQEATEVEAHLTGCALCRVELAQLRATVAMLREVEPVHAPEGFAGAVRARIEGLSRTNARPGWLRHRAILPQVRWSWRTAAAAAAVALVGLFAANIVREMIPAPQALRKMEAQADAPREHAAQPVPRADARGAVGQVAPSVEPAPLRRVIRTGQLSVEVEGFDDAARRLVAIAEGAGGFIADSTYADDGSTPRGTFVLRVPAARFGEVARQVEALGDVRRRQISGQDVTEEFIDLEARVRNLERQEARLLAFMDRATKISDLLAIESEVARVRGEVERLTGRLRFLANKVDLATITAEVSQKPKKTPGGLWDFDRTLARIEAAFLNTVRQMLGILEALAAFAAAILPVALLGGLGWIAIRRSARRADRAA